MRSAGIVSWSRPTPSKQGGGQVRHVNLIPEPDVYRLIIRSNFPSAEPFEKWLFEDVLPAIRKTGRYESQKATVIEPGDPADQVRDIALNLRTVTETWQSFGTKASQQMGLKLGLPTVPAMFEPQAQPSLFNYSSQEGRA
jgi:prophage antirepressor-like protein